MTLPLFYEQSLSGNSSFLLSEETSRHVIQVLRMKKHDHLLLTNGMGQTHTAEIIMDNRKSCQVKILDAEHIDKPKPQITIAISLLKNKSRFEWFLEKATEIGVQQIIPLICERSEKEHFRFDRLNNILISAMLQSKQSWLPALSEPVRFPDLVSSTSTPNKFIAHCLEEEKKMLGHEAYHPGDRLILIGPEGDFTKAEIDLAIEKRFIPVSLSTTRLRTETAGIVACVLLNKMSEP